MPSLDHLIPFAIATLVFAAMPGPAILYAIAQTMARGRRGGLMATAGLSVGGLVHVAAAAAGLSAIFTYSPPLFMAMKIAGALYLIWLGIQMIRTKGVNGLPAVSPRSVRRTFVQSIVVEILNPKTALFFIAFLPQFVEAGVALPIWMQFLILGLIVNLAFFASDLIAVFLTDRLLGRLKQNPRVIRAMRWTGGSVLVGLGTHMAISRD